MMFDFEPEEAHAAGPHRGGDSVPQEQLIGKSIIIHQGGEKFWGKVLSFDRGSESLTVLHELEEEEWTEEYRLAADVWKLDGWLDFEILPSNDDDHETESDETPRTVTSVPDDTPSHTSNEMQQAPSASSLFAKKEVTAKKGMSAITESLSTMSFPANHEARTNAATVLLSKDAVPTPKMKRRCSTSVLVDLGKGLIAIDEDRVSMSPLDSPKKTHKQESPTHRVAGNAELAMALLLGAMPDDDPLVAARPTPGRVGRSMTM